MSGKIEISRELLGVYLGVIEGDWVEAGHELRALLAAPVVERQDPVMKLEAERLLGRDGEYAVSFVKPGWLDECRKTGGTFLLYTSQPAPIAVVLPERKRRPVEDFHGEIWVNEGDCMWVDGWNTCIDEAERISCLNKVKELNQ